MTNTIYNDSFLISGIMCFDGCGNIVQSGLLTAFKEYQNTLPELKDASISVDAEPHSIGIHRVFITINHPQNIAIDVNELRSHFEKKIKSKGFQLVGENELPSDLNSGATNWLNIIINLLAITAISVLSLAFPPSLLLTVSLTTLSFLTTAFTARKYFSHFFQQLSQLNLLSMQTTVSLGWVLSLAHTLYHAFSMPTISGFSMIFMGFIMPVALITVINIMDEIKRLILNTSHKMNLQGIKMLFPQMAEEYATSHHTGLIEKELHNIQEILNKTDFIPTKKNALTKGDIILVKQGECFPVDCQLLAPYAVVDTSVLTGETQQTKSFLDSIPSGAINLHESVHVYATQNGYNSTVNRILFHSMRAEQRKTKEQSNGFSTLYTALIIFSLAASIIAPWMWGILSIPLLLQNITGILFAICPCTIAIAHQLPNLLDIYQRNKKGIVLRDERISKHLHDIHTVIFDKTGTLTTGNSQVISSTLSVESWARVYLLENTYGAGHPLARAIIHHYKTYYETPIINTVEFLDKSHNGLSAMVQGKKIHIGNKAYLERYNVKVPEPINQTQGLTSIYVAENEQYQGVIHIQHEIRKDIASTLAQLKAKNIKIMMLTGDSRSSAIGFNQQHGAYFEEKNIHADKKPEDKDKFIADLIEKSNPEGIWFIGDGLNDARSARTVSENGGVSCAISSKDKSIFFTDITLNDSPSYLLQHQKLNQFLQKNTRQNQGILVYGILAFTAFIIAFSISGIAVSPLLPLFIMVSTTLSILLNSSRVSLEVDSSLDKKSSWLKRALASDGSISLYMSTHFLFLSGLFVSSLNAGALILPNIIFVSTATVISSSCFLLAGALFAVCALTTILYLFSDKSSPTNAVSPKSKNDTPVQPQQTANIDPDASFASLWKSEPTKSESASLHSANCCRM